MIERETVRKYVGITFNKQNKNEQRSKKIKILKHHQMNIYASHNAMAQSTIGTGCNNIMINHKRKRNVKKINEPN